MVIQPKHYLFGTLGVFLAGYIYWVNSTWNNTFWKCFYLSIMTYFFWMGCWLLFFEIRDNWSYRWADITRNDIISTPLEIPVKWESQDSNQGASQNLQDYPCLYGEWLRWSNAKDDAPVIIFVHGFSDYLKKTYQYLVPLAYAGYHVISYDNRGKGKSRKVGKKRAFDKIIRDLEDVITYVRNQQTFATSEIALVGISLGSLAVIYQGLRYYGKKINKIISIATMSDYSLSIPYSPILFKREWWVWVRYRLFGVSINPLPEMNRNLSPLLQIESFFKDNEQNTQLIQNLKEDLVIIHAKNDPIISNFHFSDLLRRIGLDASNWFYTRRGGHNFIKYEPILITRIIQGIKNKNEKKE